MFMASGATLTSQQQECKNQAADSFVYSSYIYFGKLLRSKLRFIGTFYDILDPRNRVAIIRYYKGI
jgi:hypothetical protein